MKEKKKNSFFFWPPEAGIEEGGCTHPHPNRQPAGNSVTEGKFFSMYSPGQVTSNHVSARFKEK